MSDIVRITISLPVTIVSFADELASERKVSRSRVIAGYLEDLREQRRLSEMEKGYKAMAEENKELAKMAFELQRRVVPEWK